MKKIIMYINNLLDSTYSSNDQDNDPNVIELYEIVQKRRFDQEIKDIVLSRKDHPLFTTLEFILKNKEKRWFRYGVEANLINFVKFLFKIRKKPHSKPFPITYRAIQNSNFEMLKLLTENGIKSDDYVSGIAARLDKLDYLKYLIETHGREILTKYTLYEAIIQGSEKCVSYLLSENCEYNSHTFLIATQNGDLSHLKLLISNNLEQIKNSSSKIDKLLFDQETIDLCESDLKSKMSCVNSENENYKELIINFENQKKCIDNLKFMLNS